MNAIELILCALIIGVAIWCYPRSWPILGLLGIVSLGVRGLHNASVQQGPPSTQIASSSFKSSNACRSCHPAAWNSWHKSFHRTMTQRPSKMALLGRTNEVLFQGDTRWRLVNDKGGFWAEQISGKRTQRAPVSLMTGSHTFQNYWLSVDGGWLIQFPFVWWIPKKKWIPVSDSFLQPAVQTPQAPTVWNDSCIYCHTLGGVRGSTRDSLSTETRVGELGIACESCHGAAAEHVQRFQNPLQRYAHHTGASKGTQMVNPLESTQEQSDALCAQCHSVFTHLNGKGRDVHGDEFSPGDPLSNTRFVLRLTPSDFPEMQPYVHVPKTSSLDVSSKGMTPVFVRGIAPDGLYLDGQLPTGAKTLTVGSVTFTGRWRPTKSTGLGLFEIDHWPAGAWRQILNAVGFVNVDITPYDWDAFWRDGTVRTVGREFNGMQVSACVTQGKMTCTTCHTMHGDDPNDQLKPGYRGNEACRSCHESYVQNPSAHSHHADSSPGSLCYNCHMPKTTYGLLSATMAHRIDEPKPQEFERYGRPNACNLCHADKSVRWAQRSVDRWWGHVRGRAQSSPLEIPAAVEWAMRGDAAVRAIVANALAWLTIQKGGLAGSWTIPILAELLTDDYAAVRAIAGDAIKSAKLTSAIPFDFTQGLGHRQAARNEVLRLWEDRPKVGGGGIPDSIAPYIRQEFLSALKTKRDNRPVRIAE